MHRQSAFPALTHVVGLFMMVCDSARFLTGFFCIQAGLSLQVAFGACLGTPFARDPPQQSPLPGQAEALAILVECQAVLAEEMVVGQLDKLLAADQALDLVMAEVFVYLFFGLERLGSGDFRIVRHSCAPREDYITTTCALYLSINYSEEYPNTLNSRYCGAAFFGNLLQYGLQVHNSDF